MKIYIKMFLKHLVNGFFQWRYWSNLYKEMRKTINDKEIDNNTTPSNNTPGVVFSFDDSFRVEHWYKYGKEVFGFYDVKVTFNINAFHHFEDQRELTQKEIDMLIELQAHGHEIAHHGYKHKKAVEYCKEFGQEKWIEKEIVSLFNWMKKQSHSATKERFKEPVSFAFPHFVFNEQNIKELVPKYFRIVRGHLNQENLTPFNHIGLAPSICLDGYYSYNLYFLKKIMKLAKKKGRNLILTCHSILPDDIKWSSFEWKGKEALMSGNWRISPEILKKIINEAIQIGLEFYTTAEIAGVATFIDKNFENCIRRLIPNSDEKWILISELNNIKELDISNKGITNLGGIQYLKNLEKINLSDNYITDCRLLYKLPKLKYIEGLPNVF